MTWTDLGTLGPKFFNWLGKAPHTMNGDQYQSLPELLRETNSLLFTLILDRNMTTTQVAAEVALPASYIEAYRSGAEI